MLEACRCKRGVLCAGHPRCPCVHLAPWSEVKVSGFSEQAPQGRERSNKNGEKEIVDS